MDTSTAREKFVKYCCFQQTYQHVIVLGAILLVYLLGGAFVFSYYERESEIERNELIASAKDNHTQEIDKVIYMLVESGNLTMDEATEIINNITMSAKMNSVEETANWRYGGALFFVLTVVTTIGYGNTAPTTQGGQIVFIFYALIGIPIALAFFSLFGLVLKNITDWIAEKILVRFHEAWANAKLFVFIVIGFILFVLFPSIAFKVIQGWTYFESFYYSIVTLTTVGFGDFVPGIPTNPVDGFYRICVGCWIFIGLSYLLLITNQLQELFHKITAHIGEKLGGKTADELE